MIKLRGPLELHCWKDATARDRLRLRTRIRTAASRLVFIYALSFLFYVEKKEKLTGSGYSIKKIQLICLLTHSYEEIEI